MAETLTIGGITYDKSEVKAQKTLVKNRTTEKGTFEQYQEYQVTLKNGTTIKYEKQNA